MKIPKGKTTVLPGFAPPKASHWQLIEHFPSTQSHVGSANITVFSPSGQFWVTGTDKGCLEIFSYQTGKCINTIQAHSQCIRAILFPSDEHLMTCGNDGYLKLWNLTNFQHAIGELQVSKRALTSLSINPSLTQIAVGSDDKFIRLIKLSTWDVVQTLPKLKGRVQALAYINDKTLVSGDLRGILQIWDLNNNEATTSEILHKKGVSAFQVSQYTKSLFSAGHDALARKLVGSQETPIFQGHADNVTSLAISKDGETLITGSDDKTAHLWDAKAGTFIANLKESNATPVTSVAVHPNGQLFLIAHQHGSISAWWNSREVQIRKERACNHEMLESFIMLRKIFLWVIFPLLIFLFSRSLPLSLAIPAIFIALFQFAALPLFRNLKKSSEVFDIFPDESLVKQEDGQFFQIYLKPEKINPPKWVLHALSKENLKTASSLTSIREQELKRMSEKSAKPQRSSKDYSYSVDEGNNYLGLAADLGTEVAKGLLGAFGSQIVSTLTGTEIVSGYTRTSGTKVDSYRRRRR